MTAHSTQRKGLILRQRRVALARLPGALTQPSARGSSCDSTTRRQSAFGRFASLNPAQGAHLATSSSSSAWPRLDRGTHSTQRKGLILRLLDEDPHDRRRRRLTQPSARGSSCDLAGVVETSAHSTQRKGLILRRVFGVQLGHEDVPYSTQRKGPILRLAGNVRT